MRTCFAGIRYYSFNQINYRRKILFSEDLYSYELKNSFYTVHLAPLAKAKLQAKTGVPYALSYCAFHLDLTARLNSNIFFLVISTL